ncbi:ribosomal L1 domain-containing protein CG13096 [Drosophila montana]|uniref:ribosomal L1 domain-containing protein CG13096 n=1 Tax=Drosophila montana TaxID=40370 RepID=UPI00313E4747
MVKVQKPLPKSLKKKTKDDGVSKEKQKVTKSKLTSKAKQAASITVDDKNTKTILEKKTAKAIEAKLKDVKLPQKSKPTKKPLVLAPPESPVAPKVGKKAAPVAAPKATKSLKTNKNEKEPILKSVEKQKLKTQVAINKKSEKQDNKSATATTRSSKKQPPLAKEPKVAIKKLGERKKVKQAPKKLSKAANNRNVKETGAKKQIAVKKKAQKVKELNYELNPFDEDKFYEIVSESNVQKVCSALMSQVAEEVKNQKATPIFSDYRYMLQVCCYKIPSCPKRVAKLALKHSLVGAEDDVALIVTDLQRGARCDYEPTVQHYEDLLREHGVKQRLTVFPFNRLRNDMGTFEAKRKFLNSYDYLLCDGRLSGQASAFLGNATQKPRNVLHAVRLSKGDQLSKEISRALCRTAYRQLRKGDLTAIPVGNHEHSGQQLTENILFVIQQLQQQYPGGLANIRSMYLKIDIVGTSALPLYISMCAPPADTPYVVGPREQRMLKLKKQANEVLTKFALTKDVDFIKLTSDQVKRKAEVREKRNALKAADSKEAVIENENENSAEETEVPPKKVRKNTALKKVKVDNGV